MAMLLLFVTMPGVASATTPTPSDGWPKVSKVAPRWVKAINADTVSVQGCDANQYGAGNGDPNTAIVSDTKTVYSHAYNAGSADYVPGGTCSYDGRNKIIQADGSIYSHNVFFNQDGPERITKEKNGRLIWQQTYYVCGTTDRASNGWPVAMTMGADGLIYAIFQSSSRYDCGAWLIALRSSDGEAVWRTQLTTDVQWAAPYRVWTFSDEVIVLDSRGRVHYFSNGGVENKSKLFDFKSIATKKYLKSAFITADKTIYVVEQTSYDCNKVADLNVTRLKARTLSTYSFPNSSGECSTVEPDYALLPGGDMAVVRGNELIRYGFSKPPVTVQLPLTDAPYADSSIVGVDASGKVAVTSVTAATYRVQPPTDARVHVVDFTSKTATKVFSATGMTGFKSIESLPGQASVVSGKLFWPLCLNARCGSDGNTWTNASIYRVSLPGFGASFRTDGTFKAPAVSTKRQYVAMGDSFSSGEGNPDFQLGTDNWNLNFGPPINICHRSDKAYPVLLAADPTLNLLLTDFVACSGATTANVLYGGTEGGSWNEPAQVDALSADTKVVTLSIGGNDIGFTSYVIACFGTCNELSPVYGAVMNNINSPALQINLTATYREVLKRAPNAKVYVIDYPYLGPEETTLLSSEVNRCGWIEVGRSRYVEDALNGAIERAVNTVRAETKIPLAPRIQLVHTNYAGSPFEGRDLCQGENSDFNGLVPTVTPNTFLDHSMYSFHPIAPGHQHYKEIVGKAITP